MKLALNRQFLFLSSALSFFWAPGILMVIFLSTSNLAAQKSFQQQVDYTMSVTLDAENQRLTVDGYLDYTNNSAEVLSFISMHLWWNAFGDKRSAFAEQQFELANYDFHFCKDEEMGRYSTLVFNQEETALTLSPYHDGERSHQDVVKVELVEPISPGQKTRLDFSYTLDIPKMFDRPGYDGQLYRMTQWYPKPAVYDVEGWHPMPYLSFGEYFAEYGDYNISLSIPVEMDAVYTGVGQLTDTTDAYKTYELVADNVLDYAWFASASYALSESTVRIADKTVAVNLYTNTQESHDTIIGYIKDALIFYSEKVGAYDYPQYTLVLDESHTRGGMEYPMISMVDHSYLGQDMDNLIAHEVGHNWFQSMLGSNERDFPWLDEGLNSYYERAYNDSKYTQPSFDASIPAGLRAKGQEYSMMQGGVAHLHCCGQLGAINQCSQDMDPLSYVTNSYERMAWTLQYLAAYLGNDFDNKMQNYFAKNKHQHVRPVDLWSALSGDGARNLNWFTEGLMGDRSTYDYKIGSVEPSEDLLSVIITNKTALDIPVELCCYNDEEELVHRQWVEPASQDAAIVIPNGDYSRISINGELPFLDSNRDDNHFYPQKILKRKSKTRLKFLGSHGDSQSDIISYLPMLTGNVYDGVSVGAVLYSEFYPYQRTRWMINPMYGSQSKDVAGRFAVERDFALKNPALSRLTLGLAGKRYGYGQSDNLEGILRYNKLLPSLVFHFDKGVMANAQLEYKLHYISAQQYNFSGESAFVNSKSLVHQFNYRSSRPMRMGRSELLLQAEYENYDGVIEGSKENYLKLSFDYSNQMQYSKTAKFFFRTFAAYFPINSKRESASFANVFSRASIALTQQGFADHTFEGDYLARTSQTGFATRQIAREEGGFKLPLSSAYSTLGMSNNYGVAVNLKADLPFDIPLLKLRPFFDVALLSTKGFESEPLENVFYYTGGLALEVGEIGGLYLPLLYSDNFDAALGGSSLFQKISFKLDLNRLNPWRLVETPGKLLK